MIIIHNYHLDSKWKFSNSNFCRVVLSSNFLLVNIKRNENNTYSKSHNNKFYIDNVSCNYQLANFNNVFF